MRARQPELLLAVMAGASAYVGAQFHRQAPYRFAPQITSAGALII
jgi:hypothetical protein